MRLGRITLILLLAIGTLAVAAAAYFWLSGDFVFQRALGFQLLDDGTILATDGGGADFSDAGSQVFILDRRGRVLWRYDKGIRFAHSASKLSNGNILIPDTNADRLIEIDATGRTVWTSASWSGNTGLLSDGTKLDYPNHAVELGNGRFLVSGRYNDKVFETDRSGTVFWSFAGARKQHAPRRLANGNTLIADSDGNRVIEVDQAGRIVWQHAAGLNWPRFAQRLANGDTLIADSGNDRIVQVTREGNIVFEFGQGILSKPYQAEAAPDGTILIADAQHGRLVEIDRNKNVIWSFERKNQLKRWLSLPSKLVNGGAEQSERNGKPLGWIACNLLSPDGSIWKRDTAVKFSGAASFAIESTSAYGLNQWWGQYLKISGRGTLILRMKVRTEAARQGAGGSITFIDAKGGILGGFNSPALSGDSPWQDTTVIAPIPEGAAAAGISLSLIGPGKAWWDEVSLERRW